MTLRSFALALLLAVSVPALASAETHTHAGAKVTFETPDKWSAKPDGDTLQITSPDQGCSIVFVVLSAEDLEKALEAAGKRITEEVKDLEPDGEAEELEINGMKAMVADAKGKVDGKAVDVGFAVVETRSDKALLIFGISDATKDYEDEVTAVIKSLKPTK